MPRAIRVAAAATAAPLRIVVVARLARVHHASPLYPPYLCSPGVPIQYNAISVLLYIYIYSLYNFIYIQRLSLNKGVSSAGLDKSNNKILFPPPLGSREIYCVRI